MIKKILFVTGTRADFGKIKSLMDVVESSEDFELHVLVTGMHMMWLYGSTYKEVKKQNYTNVYFMSNQHKNEPMDAVLANTMMILSRLTGAVEPDMIVVHGDRIEALAGAIVGALNHIRVCHIEGGELSGTIDDSIRHSITKLSHIHMVANEEAKYRLMQLGEAVSSIFVIGSPDLDIMNSTKLPTLLEAKSKYSIDFDEYGVVMFHPVTSEENEIDLYAENLFRALDALDKNYIVVYPNNDFGSAKILTIIKRYENNPKFKIFPSLSFESFLVILKNAQFIIGNSSAGIREAPFYGLPSINIGTRQNARFKGETVINCDYEEVSIINAIKSISRERLERSTHFGEGNSTELFEKFLNGQELWSIPVQKVFVDIKP